MVNFYHYAERQRVCVPELGATATVLEPADRAGVVTILLDEQYLTDPEDDGLLYILADSLRPALLH